MTKKYWKDWKKRANKTKNLYRFDLWPEGHKKVSRIPLLFLENGDRIKDIWFCFGDATELVQIEIEIHRKLYDGRIHIQNETVLFDRKDIARVTFYSN